MKQIIKNKNTLNGINEKNSIAFKKQHNDNIIDTKGTYINWYSKEKIFTKKFDMLLIVINLQ